MRLLAVSVIPWTCAGLRGDSVAASLAEGVCGGVSPPVTSQLARQWRLQALGPSSLCVSYSVNIGQTCACRQLGGRGFPTSVDSHKHSRFSLSPSASGRPAGGGGVTWGFPGLSLLIEIELHIWRSQIQLLIKKRFSEWCFFSINLHSLI